MYRFSQVDATRQAAGFLTIGQTMDLANTNNTIFDPFSTLLSSRITLGQGNVFFPNVTISVADSGNVNIGDQNTFNSGTLLLASHGLLSIGSHNQFGEGGFTAKVNRAGASIEIGSYGRYLNNPSIFGATYLGDGSQLLGNIAVDSCTLKGGGSFAEPDPDLRGALLKGWGLARDINVPTGHVISGEGEFTATNILPQSHFHPKAK